MINEKNLAIIGIGNIGRILLKRLLLSGVPPDHLVIHDSDPLRIESVVGVSGFNDFEYGSYEGITYKDFVFIESSRRASESLHFHEAVHIVQWRELGSRKFLLLYAKGLAEDGYRNCVLEIMAYRSQEEFDKRTPIPEFEMTVAQMVRHEAEEAGLG